MHFYHLSFLKEFVILDGIPRGKRQPFFQVNGGLCALLAGLTLQWPWRRGQEKYVICGGITFLPEVDHCGGGRSEDRTGYWEV